MSPMYIESGQVVRVNACHLAVGSARWSYAASHAGAIDVHWREAVARTPAYFNGVVQVLAEHRIVDNVFTGTFATTDFASFLHWRNAGHPGDTRDCFGCAIVRSAEGHLMLGVQASGHLNSGRAYCPGGFIDPTDVGVDGSIDIDASIAREIAEEIGLDVSALARAPGYVLAAAGGLIAIGVEFWSHRSAAALRADILRQLELQAAPELADILIVRRARDLIGVKTAAYMPVLVEAVL